MSKYSIRHRSGRFGVFVLQYRDGIESLDLLDNPGNLDVNRVRNIDGLRTDFERGLLSRCDPLNRGAGHREEQEEKEYEVFH